MGDLSRNFWTGEFTCPCGCAETLVNEKLVQALQTLRDKLDRTVKIVSGYRCPKHNKAVGGAPGSQHLLGNAADISVQHITPGDLYDLVITIPAFANGGIGVGHGIFHVDVRSSPARWSYDSAGRQAPFKNPRS
jgi:uncharacterized protein YcbK (DUF882 family)